MKRAFAVCKTCSFYAEKLVSPIQTEEAAKAALTLDHFLTKCPEQPILGTKTNVASQQKPRS